MFLKEHCNTKSDMLGNVRTKMCYSEYIQYAYKLGGCECPILFFLLTLDLFRVLNSPQKTEPRAGNGARRCPLVCISSQFIPALLYCIWEHLSSPTWGTLTKGSRRAYSSLPSSFRPWAVVQDAAVELWQRFLSITLACLSWAGLVIIITFPSVPPITAWLKMLQRHHSFLSS